MKHILLQKLRAVSLLAALMSFSPWCFGDSPDVTKANFKTVGEGNYSYWLWDLYHARLQTLDGRFVDYHQSAPLQLELTYARDITKQEFIDATLEQWRIQQGAVLKTHKIWAGELSTLWRDVKKGDKLTAILSTDGLVKFYFNDEPLGSTTDPAFGNAFFDIWLSEKTTAPKLRKQLLALNPKSDNK
jgi:hypothetical protein